MHCTAEKKSNAPPMCTSTTKNLWIIEHYFNYTNELASAWWICNAERFTSCLIGMSKKLLEHIPILLNSITNIFKR